MNAPYVRPDVRAFLDYLQKSSVPKMHEMPIELGRQMMRTQRSLADLDPAPLAVMRDVMLPGPAGDIPTRLYDRRAEREPGPAVIYFHGGGFVSGDLDTHDGICSEIADVLDLPVIAVDYRLAPENPWPAGPDDCEAATRQIAQSPEAFGRRFTSLVIAGDSAGGTLTAVTALALRDRPATLPLLALWLIYPATDFESGHDYPSYRQFSDGYLLNHDGMAWFNDCYQADIVHWRASPMKGDLSGLPPTLVITASLDPLRDQGRAFAAALIEAGVSTVYREAEGNIHGFVSLRKALPSSAGDIRGCLDILKLMIAENEKKAK